MEHWYFSGGLTLDSDGNATRFGSPAENPFAASWGAYLDGQLSRSNDPPPGMVRVPLGDTEGLTIFLRDTAPLYGLTLLEPLPKPSQSPVATGAPGTIY